MRRVATNSFFLAIVLIAGCFTSWLPAQADLLKVSQAMSASTIAEIYIREKEIIVELEIALKDLPYFYNILPDNIYQKITKRSLPLPDRLAKFSFEDFVIFADGKPLAVELISIEPKQRKARDAITGEFTELTDEKVIFAVLRYELVELINTLSLRPPMNKKHKVKLNIGFVAYHNDVAINDFRFLTKKEQLALNWDDPWYTQFDSKPLQRYYNMPLSVFLYIEPFEIRKEIVIRPNDIQNYWADLGLANKKVITASERQRIKNKVFEFLQPQQTVIIDGKTVRMEADQINFVRRTLNKTTLVHPNEDISLASATLGIIYVTKIEHLPRTVATIWPHFDNKITQVFGSAVDEAGGMPTVLTQDDNMLVWNNFLLKPTIPKLLSVRKPEHTVPEHDADEVLLTLLQNIYHAFDFRDESRIYDTLEHSASGDLLTQIYLETQKSLTLENQGNVKVRIKKVELLSHSFKKLPDEKGFVSEGVWKVSGMIGHWGHLHKRDNQYHAKLVIKDVDGQWKVTDFQILDEKRL